MTEDVIQMENSQSDNSEEVVVKINGDSSYQPQFTIREMLEAGVHFGHKTSRWNSKMQSYIYGVRNELHIIDLAQTAQLLADGVRILREIVKRKGKILFVCTKKQGAHIVKKIAEENDQYYVTNKWLGGMLTNWKTISKSIKTLNEAEKELVNENSLLTKKEKVNLEKKQKKLAKQIGGIKNMQKLPNMIFVIDTPREGLAVTEARSLGISIMAISDTNSNPFLIDYPIPGNDDSVKAIELYMRVIDDALKGVKNYISTAEEDKKYEDSNRPQSKKMSKTFLKRDVKEKPIKNKDLNEKTEIIGENIL